MQALEFRSATTADLPFLIALRHARHERTPGARQRRAR